MKKLDTVAQKLKSDGEKALVLYLTAAYPDHETFVELLYTASQSGCDIIEIGVPFSDPIADGPVIQEASQQALKLKVTLKGILDLAGRIAHDIETPLVFMSYVNPIFRCGVERFSHLASSAGISGVILPDVPYEESSEIRQTFNKKNITYIDLLAPTSGRERTEKIASSARGFLYLVSVTGVTGTRSELSHGLDLIAARVHNLTDVPLYVGFGISNAPQARKAGRFCDGVIIGSAVIERIRSSSSRTAAVQSVGQFLSEVKNAMNN